MKYNYAGCSGLLLPQLSLGLWHNFGEKADLNEAEKVIYDAFDNGITHFDLANNYGPPPGSAEINFGKILKKMGYRDEIVISSKAGYEMWQGPYGDGGSKKYLISSLDQSLKRLGLDYVDIFYHHRPDYNTPIEETMEALVQIVRSGKALYVALSNYPSSLARKAQDYLQSFSVHAILNQVRFSMLDQKNDRFNQFKTMRSFGMGMIIFSPLAQGLLTDKYLDGKIPQNSRANEMRFLKPENITPELLSKLNRLNEVAKGLGMSLSQLALNYVLQKENVTSLIIGVRDRVQLKENLKTLDFEIPFSHATLSLIDRLLVS